MTAAPARVSIGDDGVLNRELPQPLAEVWIDRDLSWLDFNDRVLAEALDPRTQLLEQAKFLAIFTSNLDEFFMKRVSFLRCAPSPERAALLAQLRGRLLDSLSRQAECFRAQIVPALADHGRPSISASKTAAAPGSSSRTPSTSSSIPTTPPTPAAPINT